MSKRSILKWLANASDEELKANMPKFHAPSTASKVVSGISEEPGKKLDLRYKNDYSKAKKHMRALSSKTKTRHVNSIIRRIK